MKPILFDKSATTFITNGLGRLSDAKSCTVVEERNSIYELEMEYPVGGMHYDQIVHSAIIVAKPFQNGTLQAFRIYKISKPMKGIIKVYARHITDQLNFIPCRIFSGRNCSEAIQRFKTAAVTACPFMFSTDIVSDSYDPSSVQQWERDFYAAVDTKLTQNPQLFTYWDITDPNWSYPDTAINAAKSHYLKVLDFFLGANYEYPLKFMTGETTYRMMNKKTIEKYKDKFETQIIPVIKEHYQQYTWTLPEPAMIKTYLGGKENSILSVYGGEFEWNNYNVILHNARGSDKGVTIRYGKNLTNLTQEENIENTITGIYPVYKTDERTVVLASPVYPNPNNVSANFPFNRIEIKDFTSEFEGVPTVAQLREYTEDYIRRNQIGIPEVSLKVEFVNLSESAEYQNLQTVNLCDTVTVQFPELGVDAKEKVTKTTYDVLSERYTSIEIGTVTQTLARKLEDDLEKGATKEELKSSERSQSEMIDKVTGYMNEGRNGYVIIARNDQGWANEIWFLDSQSQGDLDKANRVIRINSNGFAFGTPVYEVDGGVRVRVGWEFSQSWLMDGSLNLGGIENKNGVLRILDGDGTVIGRWDNDGLYVNKGKIEAGQFRTLHGEINIYEDGSGDDIKVHIEFPGCEFLEHSDDEYAVIGHTQGSYDNEAVGNSINAAINWTTGKAGFSDVYLVDGEIQNSHFSHVDSGSGSVKNILINLLSRVKSLEQHSSSGGGDGGDDNGGGNNGGGNGDNPGDGQVEDDVNDIPIDQEGGPPNP